MFKKSIHPHMLPALIRDDIERLERSTTQYLGEDFGLKTLAEQADDSVRAGDFRATEDLLSSWTVTRQRYGRTPNGWLLADNKSPFKRPNRKYGRDCCTNR